LTDISSSSVPNCKLKIVFGGYPMKKYFCFLLIILFVLFSFIGCSEEPGNLSKNHTKQPDSGVQSSGPQNSGFWPKASEEQTGSTSTEVTQTGWHLAETKYIIPDVDLDVNGGPVKSTMTGTGQTLLDYHQDSVKTNDIIFSHSRTDEGGKVFASVQWEVLWITPADFLPADQKASIDVEHKVIEAVTWDPPPITAAFDTPDMLIGQSSSSPNKFHQPNGGMGAYRDTSLEVSGIKATMKTENPILKGKAGGRMAIYINFGDGYGMRYTYEWR
jgi:hypothetical protein